MSQGTSIDNFLKKKGSPLAGLGDVFVAAGKKYGVDPRLVVGISGIESSFGKYVPPDSNNAWGWGPGKPFGSWQEGISTVTRGLASGYIQQGRTTPALIATKYAPASAGNNPAHWSQTVAQFMRELGASPSASAALATVESQPAPTSQKAISTPLDASGLDSLILQAQTLTPSRTGVQQAALTNLQQIAAHGRINPMDMLGGITQGVGYDNTADAAQNAQSTSLVSELEGIKSQLSSSPSSSPDAAVDTTAQAVATPSSGFKSGDPVPTQDLTSIGALHQTSGLPGYPAHDYMAPAGSPVVAPVGGTITRFSGHPPSDGPVSGVHGPFGWSLYLKGDDGKSYYLTHLGSRTVKVGEQVTGGQEIGTVGDYAKYGGADHVHMGVHG